MLLWKNGMIIQKGYITVLVEKIKEYQGKTRMKLRYTKIF